MSDTDVKRARQWVRERCPHNPAVFKPDCADLPVGWCLADLVSAVRAEAEVETWKRVAQRAQAMLIPRPWEQGEEAKGYNWALHAMYIYAGEQAARLAKGGK